MSGAAGSGFQLVFDYHGKGFSYLPIILGLVIMVISVALFIKGENMMPNRTARERAVLCVFYFCCALFWSVYMGLRTHGEYTAMNDGITRNTIKTVQGRVTDYEPLFSGGSAWERFCVEAACFHYSNFVPSAGFNNAALYGGPVAEGVYLKVFYVGNTIARLEVYREEPLE